MEKILLNYIGQDIGLNLNAAFKIETVTLKSVSDTFFTVVDQKQGYTHHFSFFSIVQIIEGKEGIDLPHHIFQTTHYNAVIKVGHLYEHIPG